MASNRIGRINEELQRELSSLIRTLKDPRVQQSMVSVTKVEATGDLRYAKVYISVLDKSQEKDVLKGLKSASGFLRRELGRALQLRYTPELQFVGDDSIQYGAHILEVLRDNIVIHEGQLGSLQRFKDSVKEVAANYECGMSIEKYNDIKEGDVFECFVMEQIKV